MLHHVYIIKGCSGGKTPVKDGQTLSNRLSCVAGSPRSSTPATDGAPSPSVTPQSPAIGNSQAIRRESPRKQTGPMANLSDSPAGASAHGLGFALPSDSSQAYNEAPVDSPSNARSSSVATTP